MSILSLFSTANHSNVANSSTASQANRSQATIIPNIEQSYYILNVTDNSSAGMFCPNELIFCDYDQKNDIIFKAYENNKSVLTFERSTNKEYLMQRYRVMLEETKENNKQICKDNLKYIGKCILKFITKWVIFFACFFMFLYYIGAL